MSRRSDAGRGALEDIQQARRAPVLSFATPIEELEVILERVRRLRYDHNNPERFHSERSDVAGAIGGLLKRMRATSSSVSVPDVTIVAPFGRRTIEASGGRSTEATRRSLGRPILHLKDHG